MRNRVYNGVWALGVRLRNIAKRAGVWGPMEAISTYLAPRLIPPPCEEVEAILPGGARMIIPPSLPSARNYMTGLYEKDLTIVFRGLVKERMTVVDIGANVGYYTLMASRLVGDAGRVYAFEPAPGARKYLQRNVKINNCLNVNVIDKAISDKSGHSVFVADQQERGFISVGTPEYASYYTVETTSLDELFSELGWPAVDFIKIDIEGHEKAAFEGMRELSLRNPQLQLVMEFNPSALQRAQTTSETLLTSLYGLGFCKGFIVERNMKFFPLKEGLPENRAIYNILVRK